MLHGRLSLHDVRDVEALCGRVIARSGFVLSADESEDLLAYLIADCWKLSLSYRRGIGSTTTFSGWATFILRRRVFEWQRQRSGRGYRPSFVSLDDPGLGEPVAQGPGDSTPGRLSAGPGLHGGRDSSRASDFALLGLDPAA